MTNCFAPGKATKAFWTSVLLRYKFAVRLSVYCFAYSHKHCLFS